MTPDNVNQAKKVQNVSTKTQTQVQQQHSTDVNVAFGQGDRLFHEGMWSYIAPATDAGATAGKDPQLYVAESCFSGFCEFVRGWKERPLRLDYRADFASEEAAELFMAFCNSIDGSPVDVQRDGGTVLLTMEAYFNMMLFTKAYVLIRYSVRMFGGRFSGWSVGDRDTQYWMGVKESLYGASETVH